MREGVAMARSSRFRGVAGARQVLRAIRSGRAGRVLIAEDADPAVTGPVAQVAREAGLPVIVVPTMRELARRCGVEASCSCAAEPAVG